MLIEEYFNKIENDIASCPFIHNCNLIKDKRSTHIGFIEGVIKFVDNSILHFMEFVIETFPHHKHEINNKVVASKEASLEKVLYEIEKLILK